MDLQPFYQKYGQALVDQAISQLTYKKVDPLPKSESGKHPVMYIFRHGQSQDNADFIFSGWRDCDLTTEGMQQAEFLSPLLKDKDISILIASDQQRAIKTMKIAINLNSSASELKVMSDPRIKERGYGVLEGYSKLELYLWNRELFQEFRRGFEIIPPKGESLKMVCERVRNFCEEIIPLIRQHQVNVAISCHGNSIRGFRKYFEGLSDEITSSVETPLGQDYAAYEIT